MNRQVRVNTAGDPDQITDLAGLRAGFEATRVRWNVARAVAVHRRRRAQQLLRGRWPGTMGDMPGRAASGGELREVLLQEMPWYVSASVRFQIAVADQLRMSVTDVHAIGALLEFGPVGAHRLAELLGMTSGATTRLVDRLERAGFVVREPDRTDRRRIVLHVVPERVAEVARYYEPMGERWRRQLDDYTDDQLQFLIEFLRQGREHAQAETAALRSCGRANGSKRRRGGR